MTQSVQSLSWLDEKANLISGAKVALPPIIWSTFSTVRQIQWWWHKKEVYGSPNNRAEMAAGHILNYVVGDRLGVWAIAHAVLVATAVSDYVEQRALFAQSYQKWVQTVKGHYPYFEPVTTLKGKSFRWISPSTTYAATTQMDALQHYVIQITKATLSLLNQGFRLCMLSMRALDAASLNPAIKEEATCELVLNLRKCLEKLAEDEETLLKLFEEKKHLIKILNPDHAELIDTCVSQMAKAAVSLNRTAKKVSAATNGALAQYCRRWTNQFLEIFGIRDDKNPVPAPFEHLWYETGG